MSDSEKLVEPKPTPVDRTDADELTYRLRQQAVLADFGRCALGVEDLDALLDAAMRLCAEGCRHTTARFSSTAPGTIHSVGISTSKTIAQVAESAGVKNEFQEKG